MLQENQEIVGQNKRPIQVHYDKVLPWITQVINKLANGTYPTESTVCPCGADVDKDVEITKHDRFFIPHRMVMCRECSLIRANPRMTKESYEQFYTTEYRPLYDGWVYGERDSMDLRFMQSLDYGCSFKEFIDHFGLKPKIVMDLGCGMGAHLIPFRDSGSEIYGADCNKESLQWASHHGASNLLVGGVEALLSIGKQADLLILQDFIEHILDLDDLENIAKLVAPGKFLYVYTPGIFNRHTPSNLLWQNAHVWQFTSASLEYILAKYGFAPLYMDEEVASLWVKQEKPYTLPKPANYCQFIVEHLEQRPKRTMPPTRMVVKFSMPELQAAMKANIARKKPDVGMLPKAAPTDHAIIIGGGPSVSGQIDKIKELKAAGGTVFVIDRMYQFCLQNGIVPDYVVALDESADVVEGFTTLAPGVKYLLASVAQPSIYALLEDQPVYIWHTPMREHSGMYDILAEAGYTNATLINVGGSVTLSCLGLSTSLEFRNVHIFGFDCKVQPSIAYANGITGQSVPRSYFPVEIGGVEHFTCAAFISFARTFFRFVDTARKQKMIDSIDVYGDSLVKALAKIGLKESGQWHYDMQFLHE